MNQTNQPSTGIHVGSATLVMLFSVLCLTIFAVLSVVTAGNAWTLAEKSADSVTNYYTADGEAVQIYQQILADYDGTLAPPDSLPTDVTALVETVEGEERLSYWVPIDDNQMLWVQLSHTENVLQIVRWQVEAVGTWDADQTLNVWGG